MKAHKLQLVSAVPNKCKTKKKAKDEGFEDVDKRIQIPVATRMKMQMNLKMNASSSYPADENTRLLHSGIDQYRTLQHLNSTSSSATRRTRSSIDRSVEQGISLMDKKQFGAAIPYFTEALDHLPSSTDPGIGTASSIVKLYHQRGLCFLASRKYKASIEDLSRVMHMTPKSAELYAKRGKAYAALGEHHAALLDYNEAINIAATQGLLHDCGGIKIVGDGHASSNASLVQLRGLYLARAKVYKAMNNITHALNDLNQAENSAGGHRDTKLLYERAHLYLQCHQETLALQDFDRFLELQEEAEESRHFDASGGVGGLAGFVAPVEMDAEPKARMLDVLLERAKLKQRLALEEHARERKDAELAAVEQGQPTVCPRKGPTALANISSTPKPEPYRGIESRQLEKQALRDYSKALELDPSSVETLRLRGESLMHLARYDDALEDFESALKLDPNDFQVRMARAKLYRQRGDLRSAVEEVTEVLRINGLFIDGLKLRAQLYEELGIVQDAEKDYTSIINAHFEQPSIEDAAYTGKVTMELATGGTLNLGSLGGKACQVSEKNAKDGGSGKVPSEVAAQALLCRARLRLANEKFDAAEEDYKKILKSFANNMEAQLELQETRERKIAVDERKQREALAWLEQNADDYDGNRVLNMTSGKTKKKKKKKRKKISCNTSVEANTNGGPPSGYVLLEDEEELFEQQQETHEPIQLAVEPETSGQNWEPDQILPQNEQSESKAVERAIKSCCIEITYTQENSNIAADTPGADETINRYRTEPTLSQEGVLSSYTADEAHVPEPANENLYALSKQHESSSLPFVDPPSVVVANVMTRDEAWESMWDEEDDEPLTTGGVRIRIRSQSNDVERNDQIEVEIPGIDVSVDEHKRIRHPKDGDRALTLVRSSANDEVSGSSDDGKDGQGRTKTVLVDEKYLKKREKQLKKLRASLQYACDERNKDAIDEALARAERKQMTDALKNEIKYAGNVLLEMAAETRRLHDSSPSPQISQGAESGLKYLHPVAPTTPRSEESSTEAPSLVIRPIAYGQALQAAEQHQQQLRAYQKLIEEKDAEIARLRMQLAQGIDDQKASSRDGPCNAEARAHGKEAALGRRISLLRTHFPVQGTAACQAEALIEWMSPSDAADRVRQQVLSFVQRVITAHFPLAATPLFFATGSYPMKTYLPGSDLDMCLLVPQELESSWYYLVTQALCVAGGSGGAGTVLDIGSNVGGVSDGGNGSSLSGLGSNALGSVSGPLLLTNTVRNVTFVNADVRVVKCTVDNISVDFTANRVGALGAVRLLDAMAVRVGRHHLFKKSLILIKAWCTHESTSFIQAASVENGAWAPGNTPSSVMGASNGALSTYAVNTIVMALFNEYGDALRHPLQALYIFLDRMAEFPWHDSALTLHGGVPLNRLATTSSNGTTLTNLKHNSAVLDAGDVEAIRDALADQFGSFDATLQSSKRVSTGLFPIRACNIVDPLDDKNNLARSVSAESFPVVKRAFRLARDNLAALIAPRSSHKTGDAEFLNEETGKDLGMTFFARCWQLYCRGDGWRPDLLIHPRQIWHGKAASTSSSGSKTRLQASPCQASPVVGSDEDEDRRWESLLPSLDIGAVNALLLQHQQLQQQAAAAAAYHHGAMVAYQQPYYGPLLPHGGPGSSSALVNDVSAGTAGATELVSCYQPALRHPSGSPGSKSQHCKSPPRISTIGSQSGKSMLTGGGRPSQHMM
ncbi:hypothetical protein PsorP6_010553 [Peronosclerospora sorghi]|uniref:Uncharacterized protein n=1 Tax=Peronosclerospora sorghi TaxID=230839 RepID=A0ACC0VVM0_9STRA|nr:hypothetical protein PsorP6_010553 [Peronosclerospora sorghi]